MSVHLLGPYMIRIFPARLIAGLVFSSAAWAEPVAVGYTLITQSDAAHNSSHFGRVEAIKNIDVRSRVSGTLDTWHVREGNRVSEGALLAEIDPSVYQANVRAAEAEVAKAQAALELAKLEQQRLASLREKKAVSQSDLDTAIAMGKDAEAGLAAAQATLELRQIDLAYTRIEAPFEGIIGVFAMDQGSYLEANTVLTNLVQIDPVRVAITVSETEFIDYRRKLQQRDTSEPRPVVSRALRLADGSRYSHNGEMKFASNQLNPETATLSLFLEFPNPEALLTPGQFVDVISTRSRPQPLPAVPLSSIISDAKGDYVLLIDENDRVIRRNIIITDKTETLALVRNGLVVGERVIVEGITKAKIGAQVSAELISQENF